MRWVAGALLICAAILKAVEFVNPRTAAVIGPFGRLMQSTQIGVELVFGLLALIGICWHQVRLLLIVLFTGFTGYSVYLAMNNAASCGCFGPLSIHPWWMFVVDITVLLGLILASWRDRQPKLESNSGESRVMPHWIDGWYTIAFVMPLPVLVAILLTSYVNHRTVVTDGSALSAQAGLTVLEPEKWIGKSLPIAEFIDLDLKSGEWIVVFHRHDCQDCRDVIPRYERLASKGKRIALIEVPPYGNLPWNESACRHGRLSESRDWFVHTPVEIRLRDSIVIMVEDYDG